ncbi:hypothetical protein EDM54_06100 [Brevibacillus borstelensis]|jgi:hypothetical protein|uniref:Uncharacterized protein n=1 Tax=Brevibacillus borstelensis AK1 TaxID=1300222 RepID=M8E9J1_9BACL|nr:hypothetical protein I532_14868 [Brevibacillus borstelensis AK1]KKX53488.1 hypothetical protein X546_19095 [Brevibacillus borstelensis cifa_chp40]RNB64818.1 hypothetical protein EDM54_06100 [Brevibacillus borstelensis]
MDQPDESGGGFGPIPAESWWSVKISPLHVANYTSGACRLCRTVQAVILYSSGKNEHSSFFQLGWYRGFNLVPILGRDFFVFHKLI